MIRTPRLTAPAVTATLVFLALVALLPTAQSADYPVITDFQNGKDGVGFRVNQTTGIVGSYAGHWDVTTSSANFTPDGNLWGIGGNYSLTFAAWVKLDDVATGNYRILFGETIGTCANGGSSVTGCISYVAFDSGMALSIQSFRGSSTCNGAGTNTGGLFTFKPNVWYHITAVDHSGGIGGTSLWLYVNGTLVKSDAGTSPTLAPHCWGTTVKNSIGYMAKDNIQRCNCSMDQIYIFNSSLNATEVSTLYGGTNPAPSSTVSLYSFEPSTPGAPTGLTATPGNASCSLSWTAPTTGAAVTNYNIYRNYTLLATIGTNTSFVDQNGLINGVTYTYNVSGVSAGGEGPQSSSATCTPATTPGAPTGLAATAGNAQCSLSWSAPSSTGGSAITNYKIYRNASLLATIGTNTSFVDQDGLTNGATYTYTVSAVNAVGEGAQSSSAPCTPVTVPTAPESLAAEAAIQRVYVNWSAPISPGGSAITNYQLYLNGTLHATIGTNTSFVALGLVHNTTYSWNVSAVNAVGEGAQAGPATATTPGEPFAPTSLSATRGNTQVSLSWSAAGGNGRSVSANTIYRDGALLATTGTNTTFVDHEVTNGVTYTYRVAAVNEVGEGPQSSSASATPSNVPTAPLNLTADDGAYKAYVNWSAPASSGGNATTNYTLYRNGTALTTIGTNTTYVDHNVTIETTYTYTVTATNVAGESTASNNDTATPYGVPTPPLNLTATDGRKKVTLAWEVPATDGGRPITNYTIYRCLGNESCTGRPADGITVPDLPRSVCDNLQLGSVGVPISENARYITVTGQISGGTGRKIAFQDAAGREIFTVDRFGVIGLGANANDFGGVNPRLIRHVNASAVGGNGWMFYAEVEWTSATWNDTSSVNRNWGGEVRLYSHLSDAIGTWNTPSTPYSSMTGWIGGVHCSTDTEANGSFGLVFDGDVNDTSASYNFLAEIGTNRSYVDSDLTYCTPARYVVTATNIAGEGNDSTVAMGTALATSRVPVYGDQSLVYGAQAIPCGGIVGGKATVAATMGISPTAMGILWGLVYLIGLTAAGYGIGARWGYGSFTAAIGAVAGLGFSLVLDFFPVWLVAFVAVGCAGVFFLIGFALARRGRT